MPIVPGGPEQLPTKQTVRLPALNDPYLTEEEFWPRPTFATEIPNNSPAAIPGFEDLPPEEQEKIKARYRFWGIRLRNDLRDFAVPVGKETMEI